MGIARWSYTRLRINMAPMANFVTALTSKKVLAGLFALVGLVFVKKIFFPGEYVDDNSSIEIRLVDRFVYEGALARMANANTGLLLSVVVPCYQQVDTLRRTLDSITRQPDFTSYDIIVVNDGSPNSEPFYKFARQYAEERPEGVNDVRVVPADVKPSRTAKGVGQTVHFVSKPNGGLASARNFGLSLAHGKWVMALDSDDVLAPNFIEAVLTELGKAGLDLHNSGDVNVISTDMGDLKGNALSWQPQDINKIDIRKGNAFHCSALFLRSLWADEGIAFRPVLAWGWEDWDFWIRVHDKVGLRPVYIRKPVFLYSSAGARRDKKAHMASFCSDHMPFCKAVLQLANSRLYNDATLRESLGILYRRGHGGRSDNSISVGASKATQWLHASHEANRVPPEPSAILLVALHTQLQGDTRTATHMYQEIVKLKCDADGVDRPAVMMLETLLNSKETIAPRPATMCPKVLQSLILRNDPECDMASGMFVK